MTGYLGNDWCPAEQDHKFLMDLWDKAVEENDEKMKYSLEFIMITVTSNITFKRLNSNFVWY